MSGVGKRAVYIFSKREKKSVVEGFLDNWMFIIIAFGRHKSKLGWEGAVLQERDGWGARPRNIGASDRIRIRIV